MAIIKNPVLPGFHPDPSLCARGGDYYLATSTFEWFPGIAVYHSKDLKNWRLLTHCLDGEHLDLRRLSSAKGVWAPCLTWCETDGLFYLAYSIMNSTNARFFDVDNFLITAPDINGPWSEPVYLHSAGFDPSLFHDDDGRKWLTSLCWEFRAGYEQPGVICLVEYDASQGCIVGYPKPIWRGGTDRGCIEGPHIYKKNGWYYLMCAEGGTGYGHCVTMARSKDIWGPYEGDPQNPILTSYPDHFNERGDESFLKPQYFNPDITLQKAGHGSMAETPLGTVYLAHHCARPFLPELRCTLGRETAIQEMAWTPDGWLRKADGNPLASEYVETGLDEMAFPQPDPRENFNEKLRPGWYAPRIDPRSFVSLAERPGRLRMRGQESLSSLNRVSLLAQPLPSVYTTVTTAMDFTPAVYQHYAGLAVYYDNMNYIALRKYWSDTLQSPALCVLRVENGVKTEQQAARIALPSAGLLWLRVVIEGKISHFQWSADGEHFVRIGEDFETSTFSDEYCKYGEFTGTFVGLFCVDSMLHSHYADFAFFELIADDTKPVA